MNIYQQVKEILDNAPEGATHVEDPSVEGKNIKALRYFQLDGFLWYAVSNVCTMTLHELPCFTRKLSDLKLIYSIHLQVNREK